MKRYALHKESYRELDRDSYKAHALYYNMIIVDGGRKVYYGKIPFLLQISIALPGTLNYPVR